MLLVQVAVAPDPADLFAAAVLIVSPAAEPSVRVAASPAAHFFIDQETATKALFVATALA